jgi:hypothetical protein
MYKIPQSLGHKRTGKGRVKKTKGKTENVAYAVLKQCTVSN